LEAYLPSAFPNVEIEMTTRFSIQFMLENFEVDLLPAQNLGATSKEQYLRTMERIKDISDNARSCAAFDKAARFWGSALAEKTVDWMSSQQAFVNDAARLAKLWKAGCKVLLSTFPLWFTSFLVEIVASYMARRELDQHPNDASLVRVLDNFFLSLSKPQELCVVFEDRYSKRDIPSYVFEKRPLVLDPVNPYNNLATQLGDWTTIKLLAATTLDKLRSTPLRLVDLFEPKMGDDIPRMYHHCNFQLRLIAVPGTWVRSLDVRMITDLGGKRMNPGVEWKSRTRLQQNACPDNVQQRILATFHAFVKVSTVALMDQVSLSLGREVVTASEFADEMLREVFGLPKQKWSPTTNTHESRDVSFIFGQIPIPSPQDDLRYIYLKLSVNLDDAQIYRVAYEMQRDMERWREDNEDDAY
jgi:hypothetical protein